eukprot:2974871-Prymnesium_polylepis.3
MAGSSNTPFTPEQIAKLRQLYDNDPNYKDYKSAAALVGFPAPSRSDQRVSQSVVPKRQTLKTRR